MPSTKEYNKKLASLRNTVKMTKTMKMVAASKLRRAQEAQRQAKAYADKLNDMIARLAASVSPEAHPLLQKQTKSRKALVLVLSSDKGLCGGFNNNTIKLMTRWLVEHGANYDKVEMSFCGRRGYAFFRNRVGVKQYYEGVTNKPDFLAAGKIGEDLIKAYLGGEYDDIYLAYSSFRSALSQKPIIVKILPLEPTVLDGQVPVKGKPAALPVLDYIFEPTREELLKFLIPRTLKFKVHFALLENAAGEHGARMTAMDSATNNAKKLIDNYTLLRNRARQASITKEVIEIISGAEAL